VNTVGQVPTIQEIYSCYLFFVGISSRLSYERLCSFRSTSDARCSRADRFGGAAMKRCARVSKSAVLALRVLFVLSIILAPMAGRVDAQSTFGSLRGLTVDATGSAVPTAHIIVHGLDDNTDHEVASADHGVFEVENLKPGRYRVTGHKPGFADAVAPNSRWTLGRICASL
jgi:hypothetical protein